MNYSAEEIKMNPKKGIISFFTRTICKIIGRDKLFYVKFQGDPVGYFMASSKEKAIERALKVNY